MNKIIVDIQHYATVVDKLFFDRNIPFPPLITCDDINNCCNNDDKTRITNGYKALFRAK